MKAIRQHAFGGPYQLRLEDVPDSHPGEEQVRMRVEAAGVHLVDTLIRRGETGGPLPPPQFPMTPGREVAGVIDEVGAGVDVAIADRRAVAQLGPAGGGYAEIAVAPVAQLHLIPGGLGSDGAVAMIGTGRTTMAILELAAPAADDLAVATPAAGGIGALLIERALVQPSCAIVAPRRQPRCEISSDGSSAA
jgi:NADPH2:quinone reductase